MNYFSREEKTFLIFISDKYMFITNDERRLNNVFQKFAELCDYKGRRTTFGWEPPYLWDHVFYIPGQDGIILAFKTTYRKYLDAWWAMSKELPGVLTMDHNIDKRYLNRI